MSQPRTVDDKTKDRQWDARFNIQEDGALDRLLDGVRADWSSERLQYVLVGGPEIGTRPQHDDYQIEHVHVAVIFKNAVSKSSILKNWGIKRGNGYYLVPRNRDLRYSGWRDHHIKEFSKVDKSRCILYEEGVLPPDEASRPLRAAPSELEKKRKVDEILVDMSKRIEEGEKDEEIFALYPRNWILYGERVKAMKTQKRDFFKNNGDPNMWVWGFPGTGKTLLMRLLYGEQMYKKNLHNKFFDLFNPQKQKWVMMEDVDHECVERLGMNFIKTMCDNDVPIDKKYQTPQPASFHVLVTSNFQIPDLIQHGVGVEENKAAIMRRFWHVRIDELLRVVGLKLVDKEVRNALRKEGNQDVSKCFVPWDYTWNLPSCEPLKSVEEYRKLIKDAYYK